MLIQCRDCKQEYDDAHGACPYCSAPMSEEDRPQRPAAPPKESKPAAAPPTPPAKTIAHGKVRPKTMLPGRGKGPQATMLAPQDELLPPDEEAAAHAAGTKPTAGDKSERPAGGKVAPTTKLGGAAKGPKATMLADSARGPKPTMLADSTEPLPEPEEGARAGTAAPTPPVPPRKKGPAAEEVPDWLDDSMTSSNVQFAPDEITATARDEAVDVVGTDDFVGEAIEEGEEASTAFLDAPAGRGKAKKRGGQAAEELPEIGEEAGEELEPRRREAGGAKRVLIGAALVLVGAAACYGVLLVMGMLNGPAEHKAALDALAKAGVNNVPTPVDGIKSLAQQRNVARDEAADAMTKLAAASVRGSVNPEDVIKLRDALPADKQNDEVQVALIAAEFNQLRTKNVAPDDPKMLDLFGQIEKVKTPGALLQRVSMYEDLGQWRQVEKVCQDVIGGGQADGDVRTALEVSRDRARNFLTK